MLASFWIPIMLQLWNQLQQLDHTLGMLYTLDIHGFHTVCALSYAKWCMGDAPSFSHCVCVRACIPYMFWGWAHILVLPSSEWYCPVFLSSVVSFAVPSVLRKNLIWCEIKWTFFLICFIVYLIIVNFVLSNASHQWLKSVCRQVLHGSAGGMSPQVQARSQQFPGPTPVCTFSLFILFSDRFFSLLVWPCITSNASHSYMWTGHEDWNEFDD